MQIQRVTSLLQGIADVRNWLVQHIPLTDSMVGYDLFLKIGNDHFLGRALELGAVAKELPYPAMEICAQVLKMEEAGLLVRQAHDIDPATHTLLPTEKFANLLSDYHAKFES